MKTYLRKYKKDGFTLIHNFMFADLVPFKLGIIVEKLLRSCRGTIPNKIVDFIWGIISGIPLCCVITYCFRRRRYDSYKNLPKTLEYSPCPHCYNTKRFHLSKDYLKIINIPI